MRILLIEDDLAIKEIVKRTMSSKGYQLEHVSTIKDAENKIAINEKLFNLIIIDIILPDGNGIKLCEKIRNTDKETPILFLTSKNKTDTIIQALDAGGDEYIKKPFSSRELLARINALIRRQKNKKIIVDEIKIRNILLNRNKNIVKVNNQEIKLTNIEYRLLELLMLKRGIIVTRTEILEKIWERGGDDIFSNTIDVHMRSIRKKIKSTQKNPLIITKRGMGYMFIEE